MNNSQNRSPFSPGFTLVEVLISLILLVIVLGSIYSTFFTVQRAMERFEDVPMRYHETRTAIDIMRREIESSFLKNYKTGTGSDHKAVFEIKDRDILGKNASVLHFTSFSLKERGVNSITYFIEENDGKLRLLKTEISSLSSADYTAEIIGEIESFTVETLFNNRWVRTWDSSETDKLPDIIKLDIEFDDNGKTVRLTEYAKPRIGTSL